MGNRISTYRQVKKARRRSEKIDRQIEKESIVLNLECKILVLDTDKSSKSTVLKQMKIGFGDGYTREELLNYRGTVYRNLLDSAKGILMTMQKFGIDCVEMSNQANVERILGYKVVPSDSFSSEIAQLIHQLWKDPIIPTLLDYSNEFSMDNTNYFLTEALRIGKPDYVPTVTDVLRVEEENTAITEVQFKLGLLTVHMIDVGVQRSERKKWIHCFERVTSILFCVALSEYDQVLGLEGSSQNRVEASLMLFDSVINSGWFIRTSVMLFFTKIGDFKTKLRKVPLERFFPEYAGGADINKAAKHILWRFMQMNRARLSVYPHITDTIDTTSLRLMFSALKETVLQNALKDSDIL